MFLSQGVHYNQTNTQPQQHHYYQQQHQNIPQSFTPQPTTQNRWQQQPQYHQTQHQIPSGHNTFSNLQVHNTNSQREHVIPLIIEGQQQPQSNQVHEPSNGWRQSAPTRTGYSLQPHQQYAASSSPGSWQGQVY